MPDDLTDKIIKGEGYKTEEELFKK